MENNSVSTTEKYRTAMELFNANPTGNQAQNYLVEQGLIATEMVDYEFSIILVCYLEQAMAADIYSSKNIKIGIFRTLTPLTSIKKRWENI